MAERCAVVDQSWFCEACGADALFHYHADTDAGRVKVGVLQQHRRLKPECPANDLGLIRFRDNRQMKD